MAALANPVSRPIFPQTALPQEEQDPRGQTEATDYHHRIFEFTKVLWQSQVNALNVVFLPLEKQLDKLCQLQAGWDGYEAPKPSEKAVSEAREVLERMQEALVTPHWIAASADGGVAFSFAALGNKRAQIEILNSGEKFAHLYDLNGNSHTEDWPRDLDERPFGDLLEPILTYVRS